MNTLMLNNEAARCEALRQYQILDTSPEQAFDDLVFLAAQICGTPIALINLMDKNRQWFKAKIGLDVEQMPIDIGFCPICVQHKDVLIIPDTLADEQFANFSVVTSLPYIRFYAGVPLITPEGEAIGTLCVLDHVSREISPEQIEALRSLSRLTIRQLELRRNLIQVENIQTEYKQAQQQIRQQVALLEVTTDAVIVKDLSSKILLWNQSAEKLFGWQVEEVVGKNAKEIFSLKMPQHQEIYNTVLENGFWQGELNKLTKSGQEIIVESRWTLIGDEHLQPKSILIIDTDITYKKQQEKQFLRAQRMESIGTLASGIAHDLNNMLSPILMSVELLKAKYEDERSQQILKIVETNTKRGADLVKQVLSFARGIEGDDTGRPLRSVLQIKNLILEIEQIVEQTFPKSIDIDTEFSPNLWSISGDSTQLYQVLINLCLNARDAMPRGGSLKISAENIFIDENYAKMHLDAAIGCYIRLTISDTGIGIAQEILDRIFEPFFTTKQFGKGTGLGLSTVLGIIKSHRGFVTVSSRINKGTKFQVYLPTVNATVIAPKEDREIPKGKGEWILVVDDEASIREITKTSLEDYNYKVMTANDGIEAIVLCAQYQNQINTVIVDMMMPNMDGATTINTLQKMSPQMRILAVSGLAISEQMRPSKGGYTAFLPKPYTAQELLKTLNTIINE